MNKRTLIISSVPSHPQDQGNRARIHKIASSLQEYGCDVYFLYIREDKVDATEMREAWSNKYFDFPYVDPVWQKKRSFVKRLVRKLRNILFKYPKFPLAIDDRYDNSISNLVIALHSKIQFDIVIVEYVFFSKALLYLDKKVLKLIDTHDVFADRDKMYQKFSQYSMWYSTTKEEETKGLSRADVVVAIQPEEEAYFRKSLRNKVITVGHSVPLRRIKELSVVRSSILYIASANVGNIYSINYFIDKVLPRLEEKLPSIKLLIAGRICECVDGNQSCQKLGYVEDLDKLYDMADIVVNPIIFGTGLKIKSIEALGQSKILVTTPEGARGLEAGSNTSFLVANNPDEFAYWLFQVLTDINLARQLSENAFQYAKEYNQSVFKPLYEILDAHFSPNPEKLLREQIKISSYQ